MAEVNFTRAHAQPLPVVRPSARQSRPKQATVVFASQASETLVRPLHVHADPDAIFAAVLEVGNVAAGSVATIRRCFIEFGRALGLEVLDQKDSEAIDLTIRLWSPEGHGVLVFNGYGECLLQTGGRTGSTGNERAAIFEKAKGQGEK
jgi:hypothetical protein